MKTIIEKTNINKVKNNNGIMKRTINNEVGYNKINGCVYLHLRDLSSFFTIGKVTLSEDKKTFEFEASQGDLNRTIHDDFDNYCAIKIAQFKKIIREYNENTLTAQASYFEHLPVTGGQIHKDYIK